MAFKVKKGNKEYFDIVRLSFNKNEKDLEVELRGYATKADMNNAVAGKVVPYDVYKFTMSGTEFPDVNKANWVKDVFSFIVKSPLYGGWSGAEDIKI